MDKLFFTSEVEEELDEDEDDEKVEGTYQFQYHIRQLKAEDIKYPYGFVENFCKNKMHMFPLFSPKLFIELVRELLWS